MSVRKKIVLSVGSIVALLMVAVVSTFLYSTYKYNTQKKEDLNALSSSEYNSIFCSMYSIENFCAEDFVTYRGVNTLKLSTTLRNTGDLGEYLTAAFASGNPMELVYLGLDPAQIWDSTGKKIDRWDSALTDDIIGFATAHPETTFEVLLPAPPLSYWTALTDKDMTESLTTYQSLVNTLQPYSNMVIYFMGGEHWLIANPDNYTDGFATNPTISQKMFLFTFCDHEYVINAANVAQQLDSLKALINREKETPTPYPDLSDWDVVFFGDSIIGNYTGSFSVPGVMTGLSHARTYNCAQGGIPACQDANCLLSFPSSVDYFIGQESKALPELSGPFPVALNTYAEEEHDNRKLCFVLNFGLNDYFGGHPVQNPDDDFDITTYAGALRIGIQKLQTAYPNAEILLMAPNFVTLFNNGTEALSEKGGILTEYVDAAVEVATDMNIRCLNNYTDLSINESNAHTLLADGVHLNETGRFHLAERIIWEIYGY